MYKIVKKIKISGQGITKTLALTIALLVFNSAIAFAYPYNATMDYS